MPEDWARSSRLPQVDGSGCSQALQPQLWIHIYICSHWQGQWQFFSLAQIQLNATCDLKVLSFKKIMVALIKPKFLIATATTADEQTGLY